jgi:hypothetical protein
MVISTDEEKSLDKFSTFHGKNNFNKVVIEGIYLNIIKVITW